MGEGGDVSVVGTGVVAGSVVVADVVAVDVLVEDVKTEDVEDEDVEEAVLEAAVAGADGADGLLDVVELLSALLHPATPRTTIAASNHATVVGRRHPPTDRFVICAL